MLAHGDAEEVWTRSRSELVALVQIAFGGQVAEEIAFGDVSTGPSSDLAYATRVAAQMVGSAGMAGSLVSFAAAEASPVWEGLVGRVLNDPRARADLEDLLTTQRDAVRYLLGTHQHLVEALRDALLERHELIGHEITDVLAAAASSGPPSVVVLPRTSPSPTVEA
jgi:ATP-dependent Zn protease